MLACNTDVFQFEALGTEYFFEKLFEFSPSAFKLKSLLSSFLVGWKTFFVLTAFPGFWIFQSDCLFVFQWLYSYVMPDVDVTFFLCAHVL